MDAITLTWPGGEHEFALPLGQLRALQKAADAGPEEVMNRIRLGVWRVDDLIDTIRFGLEGAEAMPKEAATKLVVQMFDRHPAMEFKMTALAILAAALLGVEDDPVGEDQGEALPPENGASAGSTEPGQ